MRLVCNATTPQELREEIVSLLLHRAKQEAAQATTTKNGTRFNWQCEYAAKVLADLAGEIKCMELTHAWPAGLVEVSAQEDVPERENPFHRAERMAAQAEKVQRESEGQREIGTIESFFGGKT